MNQVPSPQSKPNPALVDTHVHLYDCYDRVQYFNCARENIKRIAASRGLPEEAHGYLMLAETAKDHAFKSLIDQGELDGGRWRFREIEPGLSLTASLDGEDVLTLIAGRQIVTQEGLEVLALCCGGLFKDGQLIEQSIAEVLDAGGLPVLPYGVGKWRGARGKVLDRVIHGPHKDKLFLGDNAGRLAIAGEPTQLAEAQKHGIWTLHGTDPLPIASQVDRVARAVTILEGDIDRQAPAASLKQLIEASDKQPNAYFRGNGIFSFLKLQVTMQIRKRLGKR